jgi:hypothetical protein
MQLVVQNDIQTMNCGLATIALPWFTSTKHGFCEIDLAEMLCNLMPDRMFGDQA